MSDLRSQRAALKERGFLVVGPGDASNELFEDVRRFGEPALLRSADQREARSWSLSGTFGREAFPWHTDGAISSDPPRWLVLRMRSMSEITSTELLEPGTQLRSRLARNVLLAKDHVGRARYLPALMATENGYRLRWDPRTCRSRSLIIERDVAAAMPTAVIAWELGITLVIDNYRLLHRRPTVAEAAFRVLERTYVWSS